MPSTATITSFYTFSAGTKARSSEVNTNFSVLRGHIIPIDPNTTTSINNTYDIGSSEYYWKTGYFGSVDILGSTSTTNFTISQDTSYTNGAVIFKVGSQEIGYFKEPSDALYDPSGNLSFYAINAYSRRVSTSTPTVSKGIYQTQTIPGFSVSTSTAHTFSLTNGSGSLISMTYTTSDAANAGAMVKVEFSGNNSESYFRVNGNVTTTGKEIGFDLKILKDNSLTCLYTVADTYFFTGNIDKFIPLSSFSFLNFQNEGSSYYTFQITTKAGTQVQLASGALRIYVYEV